LMGDPKVRRGGSYDALWQCESPEPSVRGEMEKAKWVFFVNKNNG
jgi:hypothetical protein